MYWWAFGGGGDALEEAHHLSSIHTQEKSEKEKKEKKRSRPTHPFTYPMPHNQLLSQTSLSSLSKEGACISQARACFTTSNSFSTEIKKLRKFFLFFYLFPIRFFPIWKWSIDFLGKLNTHVVNIIIIECDHCDGGTNDVDGMATWAGDGWRCQW